jgi:hypothetical protein
MSGMEVPIAMGAISGLGSYLGGARPQQAEISGYGSEEYPKIYPQALFQGAAGDLGRLGALYTQHAATPISMPGSYVQPLPMFKGTIVDSFATALDPALPRPELLSRSGVHFGGNEQGQGLPFSKGGTERDDAVSLGGQSVYNTAVQSPSPAPTFGGAHSGLDDMQKALSMLRPADPEGQGFSDYLFTGARGSRDIARHGAYNVGSATPEGKKLISDQDLVYKEAGYPTRRTGSNGGAVA